MMPASSGLPLTQVVTLREEMLRRVDRAAGTPQGQREAMERLEARLAAWYGAQMPNVGSRFKNKIARGRLAECTVGSDEAERIIVRVLAMTRGDAQFTVSPSGACFATENNGWTKDKERIYISGLSPLIDDAAYILNQMRRNTGGRMFFTRSDEFLDALSRRAFLTLVPGDAPPVVLATDVSV